MVNTHEEFWRKRAIDKCLTDAQAASIYDDGAVVKLLRENNLNLSDLRKETKGMTEFLREKASSEQLATLSIGLIKIIKDHL